MSDQALRADVAIVGGGPAGSTAASLLKKYKPDLDVVVIEREKFPREHVGESQLPAIGPILHEMGVWEKVEAADFPIKVGVTYRWGQSPELWNFEFIPLHNFKDEQRPAKFEGQRMFTAFQVERARYDKILLDHARELGADVREETRVLKVEKDGDRILGLQTEGPEGNLRIEADQYLDCSGHAGIIRRAMEVPIEVPTALKNMAIWDYWDNADWAVEIGVGGTRVQVLSIGTGWIWFIPLGPTRTSIGYICPVEHYKKLGKTPDEIYMEALAQEPRVQELCTNAKRDGNTLTTKDWSYVAERMVGENWLLAGESAGFADPILAGGMTLAHSAAREAAYITKAIAEGSPDSAWLKESFEDAQSRRIRQYIRFADFWYATNGQFSDLEDETKRIAEGAGLSMDSKEAFRWLSNGGFTHEDFFLPGLGGLDLLAVKELSKRFTKDTETAWELTQYNEFRPNLIGATEQVLPVYNEGVVHKVKGYRRGSKLLPLVGYYAQVFKILERHSDIEPIANAVQQVASQMDKGKHMRVAVGQLFSTLETMVLDGWVHARYVRGKKRIRFDGNTGKHTCFNENTEPLRHKISEFDAVGEAK